MRLRLTPKLDGDQSKWWVDPIVGVKGSYHFNDKWAVNGYADYGGFGAASRYAYQLLGTVSYSFNDHIALQVGYRYWADNYEKRLHSNSTANSTARWRV